MPYHVTKDAVHAGMLAVRNFACEMLMQIGEARIILNAYVF